MNAEIPGDLIVSDDVLADIAGHAAMQCYGVVGMARPKQSGGLGKRRLRSTQRKGVSIRNEDGGVFVSLYVVLEHGVNINAVSTNLVDQVSFALAEFIQGPLKGIEVHVQGIKVR